MKAQLIRLSFFWWLLVPVALFGAYQAFGLPHVIWSYQFRPNGSPYDLDVPRIYTRCTFVGPYGAITVPARNGRCGLVRFFKEGSL